MSTSTHGIRAAQEELAARLNLLALSGQWPNGWRDRHVERYAAIIETVLRRSAEIWAGHECVVFRRALGGRKAIVMFPADLKFQLPRAGVELYIISASLELAKHLQHHPDRLRKFLHAIERHVP